MALVNAANAAGRWFVWWDETWWSRSWVGDGVYGHIRKVAQSQSFWT